MRISITGRHMSVTPSLRNYVDKRISRLARIARATSPVHVVLSVSKKTSHVEIMVPLKQHRVVTHVAADDMYAAIDQAKDKLGRQLNQLKEKRTSHHRAGGGLHPHLYA
ncbi:MAG: ribosome-associated translation inhibitor RaiA [Pseudomonadota bacterium]